MIGFVCYGSLVKPVFGLGVAVCREGHGRQTGKEKREKGRENVRERERDRQRETERDRQRETERGLLSVPL